MYKYLVLSLMVFSQSVSAGLERLNDGELHEVEAQAGADIALKLTLNHTANATFDTSVCPPDQLQYCRIGISLNNRYHDGSYDTVDPVTGVRTPSTTGRKDWLVFKGVQGTINIQKLMIDGVDLAIGNGTGGTSVKAAIQLGFDASMPIQIRNFGFQALSLERDDGPNEVGPGYLHTTKYTAADGAFDANNPVTGTGRERGFIGLNMHGNLAIDGNIKVFGCNGHPRC